MFRLQDRTALIADVRNITLILIEREDDTRSWGNFLVYF
jgi:DNA-binding XRE family transcriptional regulator